MKESKYWFNGRRIEKKRGQQQQQQQHHRDYVDVSLHQDFSPRPCSETEPMMVYGTFFSSSAGIDAALPPGISFGAVSSKISCTTRNLREKKEHKPNPNGMNEERFVTEFLRQYP